MMKNFQKRIIRSKIKVKKYYNLPKIIFFYNEEDDLRQILSPFKFLQKQEKGSMTKGVTSEEGEIFEKENGSTKILPKKLLQPIFLNYEHS